MLALFLFLKIRLVNAPVKEEQLSETGWSIDADPPESVNNEPINDRLGLEENSVTNNRPNNSMSNQNGLLLGATSASNTNSINKNVSINGNKSFNQSLSTNSNDLINLNDDQVNERLKIFCYILSNKA